MTENLPQTRTAPTNTGDTRVAVAFPFSKIEISEPDPTVEELAIVVRGLAE